VTPGNTLRCACLPIVKSRNGLVNQRKALGFRRCLPIQREFIILKANLMALPCTRCDFWLALSCSSMILFRVLRAPVLTMEQSISASTNRFEFRDILERPISSGRGRPA
jgi:hypothetical protein